VSSNPDLTSIGHCSGCGLTIGGEDDACNSRFQKLTARSFTDIRFGRVHGLIVDAYCLQHPSQYCVSAKSLAAHLCGLCGALERGESAALPNTTLRHWLDGSFDFIKPDLPIKRGDLTIADIDTIEDPGAFGDAVDAWSKSVWEAYSSLHGTARLWLDQAVAARPSTKRHAH
jgi:hypothetical protein